MCPDKTLPLTAFSPTHPPDDADLAALLRSPPPMPSSPAPAYTALPYRDVDFHLAPLLHGRPGDIELETTDGKKFLVHRKVLEAETVFFHIYYGFVPVWRLNSNAVGPPHPALPHSPPPPPPHSISAGINNLFCLPKILVSIRSSPPRVDSSNGSDECAPLIDPSEAPPPVPPKDVVTAPTPTNTPYTWVVPESSPVLAAFLALIYPRGTFHAAPADVLSSIEMTASVIRAALGYQSSKALAIGRDRLLAFIPTKPIEVYAMASFFKFTDLAKIASENAISVPAAQWPRESRNLMGRSGLHKLEGLQRERLFALRALLDGDMECDEHSESCVRRAMIEEVWANRCSSIKESLTPASELLELLEIDLRGGHCGDCLVLLGTTIQKRLLAAREIPRTI